jgi:protein O-GlcNAc transferase
VRVISFSLWGNSRKYTFGAIRNAELTSDIYPGWVSRFYLGTDVPTDVIDELKNIPNTEIVYKFNQPNDWTGMFWRFEAAYDESVELAVFRDTDSRISLREKYAVDEWIESDKTFHIMRDHPYHKFPILGGMWGYKNTNKYPIKELLCGFDKRNKYGTDYDFFSEVLYPIIGDDKMVHDPFFEMKNFPVKRDGTEFVGDVFDEHDERHPEYHRYIR